MAFVDGSRVYVDECKAKNYYVAAAGVLPHRVSEVDRALRSLTRPGQRRIHFTKESDSSKRKLISAIEKLDVSVVVYEAKGLPDRIARPRCLDALVADLIRHRCDRLIIERDDSLEAADRKSIATALRSGGGHTLAYEHVSPSEHAALWISDAVAWCWHRGGDWRRRVSSVVTQVRSIR